MDLISQYELMHESGHFSGYSVLKHVDSIASLVRKHDAETLLDYGSGQGKQYFRGIQDHWGGIVPVCYDPAVRRFSNKPDGMFDGVICTDVLEHLPEEEITPVLREIFGYARKFVFLSICTREAKKTLPDGRNCHLTVKPEQWWLSTIEGLSPSVEWKVAWNE